MSSMGPTAGFLIWRLSTKWRVAVDRAMVPLGLTHAKYAFLAALFSMQRGGQRPSQRELADRTGLEALYVSKLARMLEADGLVERLPHPADTRAVQLGLTPRGRELTGEAIEVVQRLHQQMLAPLGGPGSERTRTLLAELGTLLAVELGGETPTGAPVGD